MPNPLKIPTLTDELLLTFLDVNVAESGKSLSAISCRERIMRKNMRRDSFLLLSIPKSSLGFQLQGVIRVCTDQADCYLKMDVMCKVTLDKCV